MDFDAIYKKMQEIKKAQDIFLAQHHNLIDRYVHQIAVTSKKFKEASKKVDSNEETQIEAGKFSPAETPPYELNIPEKFEIGPEGAFRIDNTEDQVESRKLTPTPFYVAARSDSGKVLILRFVNGYWLQDWVKVSKVSKSTLADLNIIPEVGIAGAELVKYVM